MGKSILFDGHEAVGNVPLSLSTALASSAWSVEGWVKLPINYYHDTDDLIIFNIGAKFSLYIEGTTGDLKFSNGATINGLSDDLIDGNRHYFIITNDLTTSKVYIDGYKVGSYTTAELIVGTDVITICDFVGRGDNFAFYDIVLPISNLQNHYNNGACTIITPVNNNPIYIYSTQVTALVKVPTSTLPLNYDVPIKIYSSQITAIVVEV